MRKLITLVTILFLSIPFLNADQIIIVPDDLNLSWSERIFKEDYCSAIFTCKILDNMTRTKEFEEFGKIYTENEVYCTVVQVEKVFFGKVDTGIVNITNESAPESGEIYLIYAIHRNLQGSCFYLADSPERATNKKGITREVEILSELSNIINNKLTCKYVMSDAGNNKLAEGFFKNGKRVKKWKHYWPGTGNIKAEYDFSKNSVTRYNKTGLKTYEEITSEKKIYYQYATENNNLLVYKEIITKKDYGNLVNCFWYHDTGKLQKQHSSKLLGSDRWGYTSDGMIMDYREYYETGKIKAKGAFLYQDSVGTWYFYDEKGKYKEKKIYKNIDPLKLIKIENKYIEENKSFQLPIQLPTSSLYGKLTDKKTNKPITGSIYLYRVGRDSYTAYNSSWHDGMYHIKKIPIGIYKIEAMTGNDYEIIKKEIEIKENEDMELDFQLQKLPTVSLSGKITDKETGKPITGASISLTLRRDGTSYCTAFENLRVSTEGTYDMKDIPIGTYDVVIDINCSYRYIKRIELTENEDPVLDFQLQLPKTSSLSGRITDKQTGKPINKASIWIYHPDFRDGDWHHAAYLHILPDGTYCVKNIPVGIYEVKIEPFDYYYDTIKKEVELTENEDTVLDFQLD